MAPDRVVWPSMLVLGVVHMQCRLASDVAQIFLGKYSLNQKITLYIFVLQNCLRLAMLLHLRKMEAAFLQC